jgi:hypothetical protein
MDACLPLDCAWPLLWGVRFAGLPLSAAARCVLVRRAWQRLGCRVFDERVVEALLEGPWWPPAAFGLRFVVLPLSVRWAERGCAVGLRFVGPPLSTTALCVAGLRPAWRLPSPTCLRLSPRHSQQAPLPMLTWP